LLVHRLLSGEQALAQLVFDSEVLESYRRRGGFKVFRTNSAGKLQQQGGWYVDFGISADSGQIHTSVGNLAKLPEEERAHWAEHARLPEFAERFLKMQLAGGSCTDDGEVRSW
jgi:hypothetical protein